MELRGRWRLTRAGGRDDDNDKTPPTLIIGDGPLVRVHETNYDSAFSVDKIYGSDEKVVNQFNDVVVLDTIV